MVICPTLETVESSNAGKQAVCDNVDARITEAFALIDANGDGSLSRIEMIKACRSSEHVRVLLGLPRVIRQEDGTRTAFERAFQEFDADSSKSITLAEFLHVFRQRQRVTPSESAQRATPLDSVRICGGTSSQPQPALALGASNLTSGAIVERSETAGQSAMVAYGVQTMPTDAHASQQTKTERL